MGIRGVEEGEIEAEVELKVYEVDDVGRVYWLEYEYVDVCVVCSCLPSARR